MKKNKYVLKRYENELLRYRPDPPKQIEMDITFTKPLSTWYAFMSPDQRKNLPPRVANALDSLTMIFGDRA